jgi:uncharacterized protein (DUF433 family)
MLLQPPKGPVVSYICRKTNMIGSIVHISPDIQGGVPVFAGTRVPIKNLFDCLLAGDSTAVFLEDHPSVKEEQVAKLLQLAEAILTFNVRDEEDSNRRKSA